jgi:PAS domain S-box-containing protein
MRLQQKDYFFCVYGTEVALERHEIWGLVRTFHWQETYFSRNYLMSQTGAPVTYVKQKRGLFALFRRGTAWLFSQKHFHFKVLSGTAAGVVVIVFLAGVFLYITLRNHYQAAVRAHTIEVLRLSSVIENDIAALESGHRGFLLTGKPSYLDFFNRRKDLIKQRVDNLAALILDNPKQRKRVMKVQEVVQKWLEIAALPDTNARDPKKAMEAPTLDDSQRAKLVTSGNSLLNQAREILQSLQDEEQIVLNQRMIEQEWATQSTQILDFLPKLERSVLEMEKEKRGYLLTGDSTFVEGYKRAVADFYTYNGYLSILVANSPAQSELLAEIRSSVERWVNTSATPEMEAKRSGKDMSSLVSSDTGEKLMADIRQMLGTFEKNEVSVYDVRASAASHERIVKTSALALLAFLAVALLVISNSYSFVLVRRQLVKLEGVETRIRSIIENILDGMIAVNEEGAICSMNPAAEKMFGCRDNEMVGHNFTKLVPKTYASELDTKPVACAWEQITKRTGSTTLALGRTRKHVAFPIEISLSEMEVDNEKLYVAMVRDVTERKRFEQEIAAEKESLAVTLRSIGDGVITTDIQGKVLMINNEAERLTGWSSNEAVGQPLKSVFNIAIDLAAQARAQRSGYRNEAHSILLSLPENATLTSRDSVERIIEQVASPIRDSKNEVAGVVLVFRDITERQRNETERRKAETLEQLGLLAGGIAHDFNNLLTAIIGNISLASLLLPVDDEMTTRLNDAKNASLRARDLAQQLLTFARGGAPIKKTASIGKLIQDTVSFSLRGSHNRSEFHFGADLWPAEIDPGQISQVIANLVVNSDQAMPNGGSLRVSCENFRYNSATTPVIPDLTPADYIRISIRDEGVGIPDQYLKRIFDPYFTTKPKGNGLGLATTYSIIKNHNGLITVESEVHVGSTFTLYLPASVHQELPVEASRPITETITGTGRVLVVDDEEAIRALVEFTLNRLGYKVTQAASALEGVNIYRERFEAGERFDAVILDLTLPGGMGGKEALKKLIEIDPTVNAIVSSGYATDATMSRYQDFGFRGVIAKPYEAAELGKIVHDVIGSSRVNVLDYPMQAAS